MTSLTADNINPKDYWKAMKSVLGEKVKPGIGTLNVNSEQLVSAIEKASAFNEFLGPLDLLPWRVVGRSVRLSTSVTQQPMFGFFSKSV